MRVHHLNCGTMCPVCRRLVEGKGGWLEAGELVCHCLLIESDDGLVLVDTGIGLADIERRGRLGRFFEAFARPVYRPAETAVEQVKALGFSPDDVRHIVVTHLDLDHAGGIADFARAKVHVHATELQAVTNPQSMFEKGRYHPAHVATMMRLTDDAPERVRLYAPDGEAWRGLASAQAIEGLGGDVLIVNLHGHTRGHSAIAVKGATGWMLHCGDAYIHRETVRSDTPALPPGLRLFQQLACLDKAEFHERQSELRAFARSAPDVRVFCAHDPVELAELSAASSRP
jgi:glyoxylase-like metal-dependent hydrolase (beta-lactamase superfamily II)